MFTYDVTIKGKTVRVLASSKRQAIEGVIAIRRTKMHELARNDRERLLARTMTFHPKCVLVENVTHDVGDTYKPAITV